MPFGGMLGSTFNFVFENQLESLQNGDRFYYLARTAGLHFVTELENNSFAKLIMANTDVPHLPARVFATPTFTLEVDPTQAVQRGVAGPTASRDDPTGGACDLTALDRSRRWSSATIPRHRAADTNYLQYTGEDHVVLGGTDRPTTSSSPATATTRSTATAATTGSKAATATTRSCGGAGDDIITDSGGDDILQGGDGNDVIQAGNWAST